MYKQCDKMRKINKRLIFLGSWFFFLGILFAMTGKPVEASTWGKENGIYVNPSGEAIPGAIKMGIDVSKYQKEIDWEKVKASGVEFAIIRCGYGADEESQDDPYWERNVAACERLGIPYGVYLYSYADTVERAKSEAQHVLRLISGHKLSYPVYYDMEHSSLETMTAEECKQVAKTFCDIIESKGYKTGIHSYKNMYTSKLTASFFDTKEKWVAQYSSACTYDGNYSMWQCSETGIVNGIDGAVDIDFLMESRPATVSVSVKSTAYNQQKVSWKKVSKAAGYEIYRAASIAGEFRKIKTVSSGVTSLSVTAQTGTTYHYKVKAFKMVNGVKWYGLDSKVKSVTSLLSQAKLTSVKRSSSSKVTVKWKKVTGASGYQIYYSTKKNSGYKKLATVSKGSATSKKVSAKKGKKYYYKIRAYRKTPTGISYGKLSSVVSCK